MKKKIVQINVVCNGSTGKIMCDIAKTIKDDYDVYCFYGRGNPNQSINCIKIGNKISTYFHVFLARLGFNGHGSYFATKRLIKKLKKINPNIIHLHNIHGYYLNLKVLFNYLKNDYKGKIIWTLHDCWAFTGHCSYFSKIDCKKWKECCHNCPQLKEYPKEYIDTTKNEFLLKEKIFTNLNNLTLVTPSEWLKKLVERSFLKKYKTVVINNGIDLKVFKQTFDDEIYDKYNIPKNKKIILGVANIWEERKGLKDFIELSKLLDESYRIVLVGVSDNIKNNLPNNIIGIKRTENVNELTLLYSLSYAFLNLTYEDNYPTVNIESVACKTPVITYDTGGCKETIKNYGYVLKTKKDYKKIIKLLNNLNKNSLLWNINEIDKDEMIRKYINLYK